MIAASPSSGMDRGKEKVPERHIENASQSQTDLTGRVDPIPDLTGPGPGHRDDRKMRHTVGDPLNHQIGEPDQPPILETMDQFPGDTFVLEGGDQPNPALEDPLRRRPQTSTASSAEKPRRRLVAGLTEHGRQRKRTV